MKRVFLSSLRTKNCVCPAIFIAFESTQKQVPERKDSTSHYITHTHHQSFEDVVQKPYELFTTI